MTGARRSIAAAVVLLAGLLATAPGAAEPEDAWSTRLLQQQAQIERSQQRLDRLDAAYARAFASNQPVELVRALHLERFAVAESLAAARRALPDLVQAARVDGVSEEILRPYRYAVQPAGAR